MHHRSTIHENERNRQPTKSRSTNRQSPPSLEKTPPTFIEEIDPRYLPPDVSSLLNDIYGVDLSNKIPAAGEEQEEEKEIYILESGDFPAGSIIIDEVDDIHPDPPDL